jgi:hypothetical protein
MAEEGNDGRRRECIVCWAMQRLERLNVSSAADATCTAAASASGGTGIRGFFFNRFSV